MSPVMSDTDKFVEEQFMPFYRRVTDAFKQNHHTFFSLINAFLGNKASLFGIRITENEKIAGEYTLHLSGANISHIEAGNLASEVHTPFGIIRPYIIIEKHVIEEMIKDEQSFISNPFTTKMKYMHEATIKFFKS